MTKRQLKIPYTLIRHQIETYQARHHWAIAQWNKTYTIHNWQYCTLSKGADNLIGQATDKIKQVAGDVISKKLS